MKTVRITALLPSLAAKDAEQSAQATAGNIATATYRALREILARPGVKGKRIREARLSLYVSNGEKE